MAPNAGLAASTRNDGLAAAAEKAAPLCAIIEARAFGFAAREAKAAGAEAITLNACGKASAAADWALKLESKWLRAAALAAAAADIWALRLAAE